MADWRIKQISELTQISIRMLRHYDKIGLLKPSYRTQSGYRCYTTQDLAKLQQIIALKYFGFSLEKIKTILQKHQNVYAHLQAQQQVIKEQSMQLEKVNGALTSILKRLSPSEAPNWNELLTLIEGYQMNETLRDQLKKTWAGQLTEAQFEAYLSFYENFPSEFAQRDKIIQQINNNEVGDPKGEDGERVVLFMKSFAQKLNEKFPDLIKFNTSILEDIKAGNISQFEATPEAMLWISKAMLAHWLKRWNSLYDAIVTNMDADPEGQVGEQLAREWTGLIDDYMSVGNKSWITGLIIWQDLAKQDHELSDLKTMLSPQEMIQKVQVKLLFNSDACAWIGKALQRYAG